MSSTLDALESFKRAAHSTSSFVAFGNEIQALVLAAKNSSTVSTKGEKMKKYDNYDNCRKISRQEAIDMAPAIWRAMAKIEELRNLPPAVKGQEYELAQRVENLASQEYYAAKYALEKIPRDYFEVEVFPRKMRTFHAVYVLAAEIYAAKARLETATQNLGACKAKSRHEFEQLGKEPRIQGGYSPDWRVVNFPASDRDGVYCFNYSRREIWWYDGVSCPDPKTVEVVRIFREAETDSGGFKSSLLARCARCARLIFRRWAK